METNSNTEVHTILLWNKNWKLLQGHQHIHPKIWPPPAVHYYYPLLQHNHFNRYWIYLYNFMHYAGFNINCLTLKHSFIATANRCGRGGTRSSWSSIFFKWLRKTPPDNNGQHVNFKTCSTKTNTSRINTRSVSI